LQPGALWRTTAADATGYRRYERIRTTHRQIIDCAAHRRYPPRGVFHQRALAGIPTVVGGVLMFAIAPDAGLIGKLPRT